ncbi:Bax inhibitor-1/YccA family protein [Clostridium sp. Marseille-P299]|uniref:Bax inhibitor-1/YccA family protein n=1 Tax=Clostridium sp. Marseille-P299 TaxID=1805477 RepID=UPI00082CAB84|nr:Bax inhibitor-1/YccA family protein [Clostridium sp. Marseille-P299]
MDNNIGKYDQYASPNRIDAMETSLVMSKTFIFMFIGLFVSAISAFIVYDTGFTEFLSNQSMFVLLIVELGVVFAATRVLEKKKVGLAGALFLLYAVINGATLSTIFLVYEIGSIFSVFVIAAIVFGLMAVYGYVTKSDLTSVGSIGMMGLIGVIVLSVINIFMKSSGLDFMISIVGLAIFIGLTAYDMQKIKEMSKTNIGMSTTAIALFGALELYLDFINIFLRLLRLFGRDD